MAILISDEELSALDGLPHLAQVIYLHVLRRHMDLSTGLVGTEKRRISERAMREAGEIDTSYTRGGRREIPGRQQVRNALNQLRKQGLIDDVGKPRGRGDHLVFRLPKATTGKSRPKTNQPDNQPDNQPGANTQETTQECGSQGNGTCETNQQTNLQTNPPLLDLDLSTVITPPDTPRERASEQSYPQAETDRIGAYRGRADSYRRGLEDGREDAARRSPRRSRPSLVDRVNENLRDYLRESES